MAKYPHTPGLDAFALRLSIAGLSAVIMAVVILCVTVTPAHRGGRPLLIDAFEAGLRTIGLLPPRKELAGANELIQMAPASELQARFVVRFENVPEAEKAMRRFRENRRDGRKMFSSWAQTTPVFANFRLQALTPSGEAVLVYKDDVITGNSNATLNLMSRRLSSFPGVAYADPYPFNPEAAPKG